MLTRMLTVFPPKPAVLVCLRLLRCCRRWYASATTNMGQRRSQRRPRPRPLSRSRSFEPDGHPA